MRSYDRSLCRFKALRTERGAHGARGARGPVWACLLRERMGERRSRCVELGAKHESSLLGMEGGALEIEIG